MTKMEIVELLYHNLFFLLENTKKRKTASLLLDIRRLSSNDRIKLINDASEDLNTINANDVKLLISDNLIRENEYGRYHITAFGIQEVEEKTINLTREIVKYFDEDCFTNKNINKGLTSRERVILLSLIAVRAFNPDTSLYFKGKDSIKDTCSIVMDTIFDKLVELKVIKGKRESFYGKSGNEHQVTNVMRHTTDLPKKTRMLYINGYKNEQRFFIDICKDYSIKEEELKYIFARVFEGRLLDTIETDEMCKLLTDIAYREGPNVVDDFSNSFIEPQFDHIVTSCLEETMMGI